MYIKEFMDYADYQYEKKILKYRYNLSSLMQKEKSKINLSVIEFLVTLTLPLDY